MNNQIFLTLIMLLVIAITSISIFKKIGFPSIFGFLFTGIIAGPYALNFLSNNQIINTMGDYGIVFLLFLIGLEVKPSSIGKNLKNIFGAGFLQMFLCSAFFSSLLLIFNIASLEQSILVGIALSYCSMTVGMELLTQQNLVQTEYGKTVFGVSLFQNIMIIPILALLPLASYRYVQTGSYNIIESIVIISIAFLFFRYLINPFLRLVAKIKSPEIFAISAIAIILVNSMIVSFLGLPLPLGAFMSGMMLADSQYRNQIHADIIPFKSILLGIFFMVVGSNINPILSWSELKTVLSLLILLIVSKSLISFLISNYFLKQSNTTALKSGLMLSQGGEFSLILITLATTNYLLISANNSNLLIITILLSMILTPIIFTLIKKINSNNLDNEENISDINLSDHVIIAGFGRVGQTIAHILDKLNIKYIALDLEPDRVEEARRAGYPLYYGDATRYDMLKSLGADKASLAVVALDNTYQNKKVVLTLKQNFPKIKIYARARNHMEGDALKEFGVTQAVPETTESSLQLASVLLQQLGISKEKIYSVLNKVRANDYHDLKKIIEDEAVNPLAKTPQERYKKINSFLGIKNKKKVLKIHVFKPEEIIKEKPVKKIVKKKIVKKGKK